MSSLLTQIGKPFEALGTTWSVSVDRDQRNLTDRLKAYLSEFESRYSRFREDSLIYQWRNTTGSTQIPADLMEMLLLYKDLAGITHDKVTPLIGSLLEAAGYDAGYSLTPRDLPDIPRFEEVISIYPPDRMVVHKPCTLDPGALAKGAAVDQIGSILRSRGVEQYLINGGGDLLICTRTPIRIGLEDPTDPARAIAIAEIAEGALCGSSPNRRRWKGFHHIIDPQRKHSPEEIQAVWVHAERAMHADALCTALFFVNPEDLRRIGNFEYVILDREGVRSSSGFPGKIFS